MARVIEELASRAKRTGKSQPKIVVTGHSLGGGLAQHTLYSIPQDILQAVVFDPSPVTAFVVAAGRDEVTGCSCKKELGTEARIIRVYESREILSDVRFFHKLFFPPHHHIQEVRFALNQTPNAFHAHRMSELAANLGKLSKETVANAPKGPWYASNDQQCTVKLQEAQDADCLDGKGLVCTRADTEKGSDTAVK